VGAGPSGLRCAELLASEGFEILVLEEHASVGKPVQCTGLVSISGLNGLGLELNEDDFAVNKIYGAKIFSPHGTVLEVRKKKPVALVIDRMKFDRLLYKKTVGAGAKVRLSSKLIDLRNGNLFLETKGHGELVKSKIVVGADGPNSVVRHIMHPNIRGEKFIHALQYRMQGSFDPKNVELHFGKFAKGFFAWVVPESDSIARIGLGTKLGDNVESMMNIFLKEKGIEARVLSKSSALIPVSEPFKGLVSENNLLLGDAAFQTKATTGGGLVMGLAAAKACAGTIANHLKHHTSLNDYTKNLASVNRELALHWKIYSHLHSMGEDKMDNMFAKAKKAGLEQFLEEHGDMDRPSKFVRKMLLKPRLWGLAPTALKFALG